MWRNSYHRRFKRPGARDAYNKYWRKYRRKPEQRAKSIARSRAWHAEHPTVEQDTSIPLFRGTPEEAE